MHRRDILPIHLVSKHDFIARVKCIVDWNGDLVVLPLEVSIVGNSDQLEVLSKEVLFFLPHHVEENVTHTNSLIESISNCAIGPL